MPAIPKSKPQPRKVWVTFQCPIELRNEASKVATRRNINISSYLRRQLEKLIEADKIGKKTTKDVLTDDALDIANEG